MGYGMMFYSFSEIWKSKYQGKKALEINNDKLKRKEME